MYLKARGLSSQGRAAVVALAVGAATALPGFAALAVLATVGNAPAGTGDLWHSRTHTIGYALALPGIVAGLVVVAARQRPRLREGRWALASAVGGCMLGALAAGAPLLADAPAASWTMREPHRFTSAGWVNAAFMVLVCGAVAGLSCLAVRRLLRSGTLHLESGALAPLSVTMVAAVSMMVFVVEDAWHLDAPLPSAIRIGLVAIPGGALLVFVVWLVTRMGRRLAAPVAVWVAAGVGMAAFAATWPPLVPSATWWAVPSSALVAVAFTESMASSISRRHHRWPCVLAVALLLLGGLTQAVGAQADGARRPLAVLAASVLASVLLLWSVAGRSMARRRVLNSALFAMYCMFVFYLAARVTLPGADDTVAGASVAVADTAFDIMVFTVIQTRFGDAGSREERDYEVEYVGSLDEWKADVPPVREVALDPTRTATTEVMLLGVAVALGLLTLLGHAARPLGLDKSAGALPADRLLGLVAFVAMVTVAVTGDRLLARWRSGHEPPRTLRTLDLPWWWWIAPTLASGIWLGAGLMLTEGKLHLGGLAGLVAVVVALLSFRSLTLTPIRLQLRHAAPAHVAVAALSATALGSTAFWLVAHGLWASEAPLAGQPLAAVAVVALLGNILLFTMAGRALAWGLPTGRDSEHVLARSNIMSYVLQDGGNYGVVLLIGVGIPVYAASRNEQLEVHALNIVASLVFLPGLVNAVVWGLHNWTVMLGQMEGLRSQVPRAVVDVAGGSWQEAVKLENRRQVLLRRHIRVQQTFISALMVLGLGYLGKVLVAV